MTWIEWSFAAFVFAGFLWMAWRTAISGNYLDELRSHPSSTLCLTCSIVGLIVFLFWIAFSITPLSIDRIRPMSIPLGLWGFGTAALCLFAYNRLQP